MAANPQTNAEEPSQMLMENNNKPMENKPSTLVWLASLAALMNAVSLGLVVGFLSTGLNSMIEVTQIREENVTVTTVPSTMLYEGDDSPTMITVGSIDWNPDNKSWFAGIISIGALIGALSAGPVLTKLGPKFSVICSNVPYVICWIIYLSSQSFGPLIFGGFLGGLSLGFSSGAVPVYCIEISTPNIRGTLGVAFQLFCNVGLLLAALIGFDWDYRTYCGISLAVCTLGPAILFLMPESPNYLFGKFGAVQSKPLILNALRRLRTPDADLEAEFNEIKIARETSGPQRLILGINEIKEPGVWKPLLISLALMATQQLSGVNAVVFFQTDIFKETGLPIKANVVPVISGLVLLGATFTGSLIVDKIKRTTFLFTTGIGMFAFLMTLAIYFQCKPSDPLEAAEFGSKYGIIALIGMEGFLLIFFLSLGPIPWMMVPEMTPYFARTFITAVAGCFNWFLVFMITKNFAALSRTIGSGGAFFLFSACVAVSVVFFKTILPETKGKTNEQLEKLFE